MKDKLELGKTKMAEGKLQIWKERGTYSHSMRVFMMKLLAIEHFSQDVDIDLNPLHIVDRWLLLRK